MDTVWPLTDAVSTAEYGGVVLGIKIIVLFEKQIQIFQLANELLGRDVKIQLISIVENKNSDKNIMDEKKMEFSEPGNDCIYLPSWGR